MKHIIGTVALVAILGCGGSAGTDVSGSDVHTDPGPVDSDALTDVAKDLPNLDATPDDGQISTDDSQVLDPGNELDASIVEDVGPENPDPGPPPMCPCDKNLWWPVCGCNKVEYENPTCAACHQCKDIPPDPPHHDGCVGCTGTLDCDMANPWAPCDEKGYLQLAEGWGCYKPLCSESDECMTFGLSPPCGPVCGVGPDEVADTADDVTYDTLCGMMVDYWLNSYFDFQDYLDYLNHLGECCLPDCTGKECGDDGCKGTCGTCSLTEFCCGGQCHPSACSSSNEFGECPGQAACGAEIEVLCDAPVPGPEICDGLDNDCEGQIDDGFDDTDQDGIPDCCEPNEDGIPAGKDNCPNFINPDQNDSDMDGIGDECDADDDNDGYADWVDCKPFDPEINPEAAEICDGVDNDCNGQIDESFPDADENCLPDCVDHDSDGDGVPTEHDNCPDSDNTGQEDTDGDWAGDACDADDDNDQIHDNEDNCPLIPNVGQEDADKDGIGDACQGDADGDGFPDDQDCRPFDASSHPVAEEKCDWVDNNCDGLNNEGFPNPDGIYNFAIMNCEGLDEDGDCVEDSMDNCPGLSNEVQWDHDNDGLGDDCDPDKDGDGVNDETDCNPEDYWVYQDAPEKCDGKDNDCDGETDEDVEMTDCQDCDPCTIDLCNPTTGCQHEPIPDCQEAP